MQTMASSAAGDQQVANLSKAILSWTRPLAVEPRTFSYAGCVLENSRLFSQIPDGLLLGIQQLVASSNATLITPAFLRGSPHRLPLGFAGGGFVGDDLTDTLESIVHGNAVAKSLRRGGVERFTSPIDKVLVQPLAES
ncbi:hypothetical protein CA85_05580 [Allorhodopirellula solitaria]|uniref:Uncharacterized protein n=1 Tax=Allorhodopirellula solitaria TaxID=2527987 RepID=A0A5C5YKC4_9BACT|nr:hypothetical protein CA85_05580 [Allorhodopirellula solitaria]